MYLLSPPEADFDDGAVCISMHKLRSWLSSPYESTAESRNAAEKQNTSPENVVFKEKSDAKWI